MSKAKKRKLHKVKVPIFTEEYAINVYIGSRPEILKSAAKYLNCSLKAVENDYGNCAAIGVDLRGRSGLRDT